MFYDNSTVLAFFPSLMMLHVSLMTLQGTRKLHFSFQITTLSARKGDQKGRKKKKGGQLSLSESTAGPGRSPALQKSPARDAGARGWGKGQTHTCKHARETDTTPGNGEFIPFNPNLQFNYNPL